jgi:polysaccharide biosynthesis/export protein
MRILNLLNAIAGLVVLSGCAGYQPAKLAFHDELVTPYRLDSGDALRVVVFGQADLTNTYAVDKAGMISMPLIGFVQARDRTTKEIEQDIAAKLRAEFLKNPDVSVEVERYRPFFAMGEISASGQYSYAAGMTVQQAIAAAGGFTARADRHSVTVTRSFNGQLETAHLKMTDPIMPGDTIYVRQRIF